MSGRKETFWPQLILIINHLAKESQSLQCGLDDSFESPSNDGTAYRLLTAKTHQETHKANCENRGSGEIRVWAR